MVKKQIKKADVDILDRIYTRIVNLLKAKRSEFTPFFRRIIRFIALPYCYIKLVNWNECSASRKQVVKDFLYIFFKLKYFPDNYSQCRLWEKDKSMWHLYYGSNYDPYQRGRLEKEVKRPEYQILFDDKELCYDLCQCKDLPLPKQYGCIDPNDNYKGIIESILYKSNNRKLIIKPVYGYGGKGIYVALRENKQIFVHGRDKVYLIEDFSLNSRSVIQEFAIQHESLEKVFPTSVNSFRVMTLLTMKNEVLVIAAYVRFGRGKAVVDNRSAGGIAVGVNIDEGTLMTIGYDYSGKCYSKHPESKITFSDFRIPYWSEVIELSKKIQYIFPYIKMLGSDIAVTPTGPIILEINPDATVVGIEQTSGPILANKQVRDEFRNYDLLINGMSRQCAARN